MDDNLVPAPSEPRLRGNSREYLYGRLVRGGFTELLRAIDAGELSVFAAAAEVGLVRRPEPTGRGSPNARKRIDWAIHRAYRERADAALVPETPSNGRSASTTPIDLAAAIAEWEEAQRASRDDQPTVDPQREPAPAAPPPEPERIPFPIHGALPCTSCGHVQAAAALREVIDGYLAACRGKPHQTGSTLPRACCQRLLRHPDVRAMIA